VTVVFGEPPDPSLSSLRVLDTSGANHATGPTQAVAGQPLALRVAVARLGNGVYTVAWRTVSRVDGHLAAGTFAFGVGVAPGAGGAEAAAARAPGPSTLNLVSRWLLYAGLMLALGGAVVGLACLDGAGAGVVMAGGVAAALGALGIALDQTHGAGLSLSRLFDSPFSHHLWLRLVPAAVVVVAAGAAALRRKPALAVAGVATVVAMAADVDASHVAAAHSLRLARMAVQTAHFAAAGVWVGGLAALLLGLRGRAHADRPAAVRRYSAMALAAAAVVAASGVQRAFDEVGTLHALAHAAFGRWVLLKSALLVALLVLGARNRFRSVPAASTTLTPLRRVGAAELALVVVVLGATAVLQGLAPPASAAKLSSVVATGADAGTTMKARLEVSPGRAGFNRFDVRLRDYDTGRPVEALAVSLRFALPARPDLGQATLALAKAAAGEWSAAAANLSIDGRWRVTVVVQQSGGGTEVPLTVATRAVPARIDVQHAPGSPDLYTLHAPNGDQVQVYIDPGTAGVHFNEVHVTVVGPDGQEVPTTSVAVDAPGPLAVRKLDDAGHFVADLVDATRRAYRLDVQALLADGTTVAGRFTIPIR